MNLPKNWCGHVPAGRLRHDQLLGSSMLKDKYDIGIHSVLLPFFSSQLLSTKIGCYLALTSGV